MTYLCPPSHNHAYVSKERYAVLPFWAAANRQAHVGKVSLQRCDDWRSDLLHLITALAAFVLTLSPLHGACCYAATYIYVHTMQWSTRVHCAVHCVYQEDCNFFINTLQGTVQMLCNTLGKHLCLMPLWIEIEFRKLSSMTFVLCIVYGWHC